MRGAEAPPAASFLPKPHIPANHTTGGAALQQVPSVSQKPAPRARIVLRPAASVARLRDTPIGASPAGGTACHRRQRQFDPPTTLRIGLLVGDRAEVTKRDPDEKRVTREFPRLVQRNRSTLRQLSGLSTVRVAELLVEVGDQRRITAVGFAPFSGTAPLAASTVVGLGRPLRHRQNPAPTGTRRHPHHQGGPPHPQAPPLRCRLAPHDRGLAAHPNQPHPQAGDLMTSELLTRQLGLMDAPGMGPVGTPRVLLRLSVLRPLCEHIAKRTNASCDLRPQALAGMPS
jgi:hypothetical protein